jgi:hypothetical protein
VLNFALLFAALTLLPNNWGMLWFAPFLWFGYRLADVIGDRARCGQCIRYRHSGRRV